MTTDLTFFTNEPDATLLDRFKDTLNNSQYFDVLVGYFRTSGFHQIFQSLKDTEKIRILVGINVDKQTVNLANKAQQLEIYEPEQSAKQVKENYSEKLVEELDESQDENNVEISVQKFIEFIQSGKLEIKAYKRGNIHAKVYIIRYNEKIKKIQFGSVITGSSNFSESGFIEQREFNVELKNKSDIDFALLKFNELWQDAIDISEEFIETIQTKTWLNDQITPYELYLKMLYEYFKEDINADEEVDSRRFLPEGFMELKYQTQAVVSIKKILDSYNGVFIADVVGLGKTYISALLAQQLSGCILVICPPVLQEYWEDTFRDFKIGGIKVESLGKLDSVIKHGIEKYDYIFIDEAHRFRNETTGGYEKLQQICLGKKVVLISATPLNNKPDDIFAQLKLFQIPKKSTIPGVTNLESFFKKINSNLKNLDKKNPEYLDVVKETSKSIREKIFKYIMVRRTRKEVVNFFSEDIIKQGLSFPQIASPQKLLYELDSKTEAVFLKTISLLKQFSYSRYTPLFYLKKQVEAFQLQQQKNIGGFMKTIIVKRLESSFFAFKNTVDRFVVSHKKFIDMYKNGTIYISKKINVYDFLDADNEEELIKFVDSEQIHQYKKEEFKEDYLKILEQDLEILINIQSLWQNIEDDPKINKFIDELKSNKILINKKMVVFTESTETGTYLYQNLNTIFKNKVFFYSSKGGYYCNETKSIPLSRDIIKENFDPKSKAINNDIQILITTDVLAEGINLHRANIIINYDLPWNPTRVLQRVGRVNRVGTEHDNVFIFNFFPTSVTEEHLNLEANIVAKIQAFHDTLGEDAKYLTDDEEIATHNLFGDTLYRKLTSKKTYEGEDESESSELEFLNEIRKIRDKNQSLFEKIKRLPKKARSAREIKSDIDQLITFIRKGKLKKFFISNNNNEAKEIDFYNSALLMKCLVDEKKQLIPKDYYQLLYKNKLAFDNILNIDEDDEFQTKGGKSNIKDIIKVIKIILKWPKFTDDEEDFLKQTLEAFQNGIPSKKTAQTINNEFKKLKTDNPIAYYNILKTKWEKFNKIENSKIVPEFSKREIILSEYLVRE